MVSLPGPSSLLFNFLSLLMSSFIGYFAVHILGLALGTLLLPPSPSFFRRQQSVFAGGTKRQKPTLDTRRDDGKATVELSAHTIMWWSLTLLTKYLDIGGGVSRRMVCTLMLSLLRPFSSHWFIGDFTIYPLDICI